MSEALLSEDRRGFTLPAVSCTQPYMILAAKLTHLKAAHARFSPDGGTNEGTYAGGGLVLANGDVRAVA